MKGSDPAHELMIAACGMSCQVTLRLRQAAAAAHLPALGIPGCHHPSTQAIIDHKGCSTRRPSASQTCHVTKHADLESSSLQSRGTIYAAASSMQHARALPAALSQVQQAAATGVRSQCGPASEAPAVTPS